MPTPIFTGRVNEAGQVVLDNRDDARTYVRILIGKPIEVVVRPKHAQRSVDQNAYWWAIPVKLLAEHCGYTDTQMHYALLGECFGYIDGPHGHPVPKEPSSAALTAEQFSTLISWVLTWAPTELGVDIPAPGEVL
jgi:hypothetical protein